MVLILIAVLSALVNFIIHRNLMLIYEERSLLRNCKRKIEK